jgi:hypothetical protein
VCFLLWLFLPARLINIIGFNKYHFIICSVNILRDNICVFCHESGLVVNILERNPVFLETL